MLARRTLLFRAHCGFTLIEVLVVVAIIAMLLAILLPSLSSARDQAKRAQCLAHLQQFGRGFYCYATDNKGFLCSGQADPRRGFNYPTNVSGLERLALDRVGWVADLYRLKIRAGDMLCPSNLGQQTEAFSKYGLAGAPPLTQDHYESLIKRGVNTNYCQSWYMARSGYSLDSEFTSSVFASGERQQAWKSKRSGGDIRTDLGPLKIDAMRKAGASRVPLLGDARPDFLEKFLKFGRNLRETKVITDGPGGKNGTYAQRFAPQHWDDFGVAHGKRRVFGNEDGNMNALGNLLMGDGHAESFRDTFSEDGEEKPDGQLDQYDLRGKVFDGVLSLGRRSKSDSKLD